MTKLSALFPPLAAAILTAAAPGAQGAAPAPGARPIAYPTKPIRVLVGFAPGGGSDILARTVGQRLAQRLGQPVVTDNRAGAGGTIAMDIAAKSPADGYTLLVVSGSQVTNASLVTKVPFDILKTFAPITQMTSQPYVLVVHPGLPAKSVKEFIAYARARPGALNYASSGTGSSAHLGMELFKHMAAVDMVHVPYKGSGQAFIDLLGGQVQSLLASAISAMPHVKGGRLRALGVTSARRAASLPELPTIAEAGLPGFDVTGWYGLVAPAGTPQPIILSLNAMLREILEAPELREKFAGEGTEAAPGTPAQFGRTIANEIEKWSRLVAATGIQLQ